MFTFLLFWRLSLGSGNSRLATGSQCCYDTQHLPNAESRGTTLAQNIGLWLWKRNAVPGCGIRCDLDLCYYSGPPQTKTPHDVNPCEWNQTQGTAPQTRVFISEIKGNSNLATAPNALEIAYYRIQRDRRKKQSVRTAKSLRKHTNSVVGCELCWKNAGILWLPRHRVLLVDVSSGPRDIAGHLDDRDVTYEMTHSTLLRQKE